MTHVCRPSRSQDSVSLPRRKARMANVGPSGAEKLVHDPCSEGGRKGKAWREQFLLAPALDWLDDPMRRAPWLLASLSPASAEVTQGLVWADA